MTLACILLLIFRLSDELVPVYIVFRTPLMEDATLKSYLSRLAIHVEAIAVGTAPPPESEPKGPPPKELLASETITSDVEPVIIRHDEAESPHIYVVWKLEIFMSASFSRRLQSISNTQQVGLEEDFTSQQYTFCPQHP